MKKRSIIIENKMKLVAHRPSESEDDDTEDGKRDEVELKSVGSHCS